ncbi:MAG: IS110 family transposase [Burkholderiales bacterium]
MNATTVAVDLAKNVFEIAVADKSWKVVDRARLTRSQFARWFDNRAVDLVVMEACGSAHHWARTLRARGIEVRLLPAQYVRAYVKRNKTDAADAAALLEAARASDIKPVSVKSIEQQALQALHRMRSGWMSTRTRRINTLRGFCREFGLEVPVGAARGTAQIARLLADEHSGLPAMLRTPMRLALEEIRLMEARIEQLERELAAIARQSPACAALTSVPGIGLLTSTAMVAAVGDPRSFDSGRRYSSFLGLTPREYSSGGTRYLGRISKRGDRYIRMLLTHGARSVLRAATVARRTGRELDRLRTWALAVQERTNHNKATCALANKLARIAWAVWVKHEKYQAVTTA